MFCIRRNACATASGCHRHLNRPDADSTPLFAAHQAEGVFQIRTETQHSGTFLKPGGKASASGTYPRERAAFRRFRAPPNHPSAARCRVMYQESVGNALQIRQRLFVAIAGGLPLRLPEVITSGHCSSVTANAGAGSQATLPRLR